MEVNDRIVEVQTYKGITTGIFLTHDISEANLLRSAILSEIETYTIDTVVFHVNTSSRHDEIIALRLGQLVLDHSRLEVDDNVDYKIHIDVQGPSEFTTDDIPELPFRLKTPIATLKAGQRIVCDVFLKKGQGKQHVKWRPVSTVTLREHPRGYLISFKSIGMLWPPDIFEYGYNKMADAARRPPITLFSHPLVPENI